MNRKNLNQNTTPDYKVTLYRRLLGIKKLKEDKMVLIFFIGVIIIESVLLSDAIQYIERQNWCIYGYSVIGIGQMFVIVLYVMSVLITYSIVSTPWDAGGQRKKFWKIGLYNNAKQTPELIYRIKKKGITTYEYYCNGIPLSKFKEDKEKIETVLTLSITDISQGKNKSRVVIKARSGKEGLPDYIGWKDSYLQAEKKKIVLGMDMNGLKVINLDDVPHIFCGGSTGSGKTVLLKNVLYQLHQNKAEIFLVDFKGGVDFTKEEREAYHYISSKQDLLEVLNMLVEEMEKRKELFSKIECSNITEYNFNSDIEVPRIILASDEIAFAFRKKGLDKQEKEIVEKIESQMELLAQQSRFAGIHLWLSTQRGDADTIPPQIRSNMTLRICGKASEVLSKVNIDNTLASEIPNGIHGRFADDESQFFQAFYFSNDMLNYYE